MTEHTIDVESGTVWVNMMPEARAKAEQHPDLVVTDEGAIELAEGVDEATVDASELGL